MAWHLFFKFSSLSLCLWAERNRTWKALDEEDKYKRQMKIRVDLSSKKSETTNDEYVQRRNESRKIKTTVYIWNRFPQAKSKLQTKLDV